MGRPRSFDEDEVLDRALTVFWDRGYESTSVADLERAMGIKAGSIYKAFGDKHSLFLRALTRYLEEGYEGITMHLVGASGPGEVLQRLLYGIIDSTQGCSRAGCFAVNCAVELAPHDDAVRTALGHHDGRMQRLLRGLIERGQAAGEFTPGSPDSLALQLRLLINGIQVEGKKQRFDVDTARLAVDDFLGRLRIQN